MTRTLAVAVLGLPLSILACTKSPPPSSDAGTAPAALVVADAGADGGGSGDDVEPVYPIEANAPAIPLAEKLCVGLTEMQEKKRAACCTTTPGIVFTSECTRTLSAAIRHKAATITEGAVDACIAAFDKTLDGCEWVGPFAPGPPPQCEGIVKGLLADGQKCRSSLECTGSLRCKGVGPTTPGKCSAAKEIGEICGGTVDTLATYVRQNDLDKQHPECASLHCTKHRCAAAAAEHEACVVTQDCAEGLQCLTAAKGGAKKECVRRELPKLGEACPGGVCETGAACVLGKCGTRKASGEACANDFECRGGCLKADGGTKGTCGPRCDIR